MSTVQVKFTRYKRSINSKSERFEEKSSKVSIFSGTLIFIKTEIIISLSVYA